MAVTLWFVCGIFCKFVPLKEYKTILHFQFVTYIFIHKSKTLFFAIEMQWNFDIKFSFCTYMYVHEDVYSNKMVDYCVFNYDLV